MRVPEIKPHKKYRFDEIIEAVATSARAFGVKLLAPQLDVDERYLHSKLTVSQSSSAHFLRADEMIAIRLATGDLTSLRMEAELHDHLLVPRKSEKTTATIEDRYFKLLAKAAELVQALAEILADLKVTEEERKEKAAPLIKELERLLAAESAEE